MCVYGKLNCLLVKSKPNEYFQKMSAGKYSKMCCFCLAMAALPFFYTEKGKNNNC